MAEILFIIPAGGSTVRIIEGRHIICYTMVGSELLVDLPNDMCFQLATGNRDKIMNLWETIANARARRDVNTVVIDCTNLEQLPTLKDDQPKESQ